MTSFNSRDIVLVKFPFTNLSESKIRPALVLAEKKDDIVIVGIFSKVPDIIDESWFIIGDNESWFEQTGLKKTSVVKTEKITSIHNSIVIKKIGFLPESALTLIKVKLRKMLNI